MDQLQFASPNEWRRWLEENHASHQGLWIIFSKAPSRLRSMTYEQALDEALCFGWIDSIIRRIDDERYARKFTPRSAESHWSDLNKWRLQRLIRLKRMRPAGLDAVKRSRQAGTFSARPRPDLPSGPPREFARALRADRRAREFFKSLPPSEQQRFSIWIGTAKRKDTQERRVKESLLMLSRRQRLGLK